MGSPLYSTWEVSVTRHLFNSKSFATSAALVDVCTAQSVIFVFCWLAGLCKKTTRPIFTNFDGKVTHGLQKEPFSASDSAPDTGAL